MGENSTVSFETILQEKCILYLNCFGQLSILSKPRGVWYKWENFIKFIWYKANIIDCTGLNFSNLSQQSPFWHMHFQVIFPTN